MFQYWCCLMVRPWSSMCPFMSTTVLLSQILLPFTSGSSRCWSVDFLSLTWVYARSSWTSSSFVIVPDAGLGSLLIFTLQSFLKSGTWQIAKLQLLHSLLSTWTYVQPAPHNAVPNVSDADLIPKYQHLVSCLLYLTITTCLDISYYAMWLGQHNMQPNCSHFLLAKHVLCYLAGMKTLALSFGAPLDLVPSSLARYMQNVGCSDADWALDSMDRKSISGYSFFFEGSLVSWSAVKQKSITLSSMEAEYYVMTHTFKEALCVFLSFMKFPVPCPFPILLDNQAACSLSNSIAISAWSKHIDILSSFYLHPHSWWLFFYHLDTYNQHASWYLHKIPFSHSFYMSLCSTQTISSAFPCLVSFLLSILIGVCWTVV